MYRIDKTIIFNHHEPLKDQLEILAQALRSIWNEFQNHIQMTGNLNVYYLVRDKLNFINNSVRSSLDFTVVETNTYLSIPVYHFCCKGYMTWTDLSINCFKLHECEYLDHTYSPQPDKYPFQGNIKKKSKFVFFRIYRLSEIFFAR